MEINKGGLARLLREGDEGAYDYVYRNYYPFMCKFATKILNDFDTGRDVSQSTISLLWEKRELIQEDQNIIGYLLTSLKNNCLNHITASKRHSEKNGAYASQRDNFEAPDYFSQAELLIEIDKVLDEESEQRSEIFRLRKLTGLSTKEVAKQLNLSEKKVRYNVGLVMDKMRIQLSKYLPAVSEK